MADENKSDGELADDQKWLEVAAALQEYRSKVTETAVDVPKFVLVGLQSAGKTRLLSCFAKRKIGAVEKDETGTRCPIIYKFEVISGSEYCTIQLSPNGSVERFVTFDKLVESLRTHTSKLQATPQGFSKDPVHVGIFGKVAINSQLVDLPGLMPLGQTSEVANEEIERLIVQQLMDKNTVPIVVVDFHRLDEDTIRADLERIDNCFRKLDEEKEKSLRKEALIFVTYLDKVVREVHTKHLEAFANFAKTFGFDVSKIVFMSLAPEMLDPNHKGGLMYPDESSADFSEIDNYFRTIVWEKEKKLLPTGITLRSYTANGSYQIGVKKAVKAIEKKLIDSVKSNITGLHRQLATDYLKLEDGYVTLLPSISPRPDDQLASDYLDLLVEVYFGIVKCDTTIIADSVKAVRSKFSVDVKGDYVNLPNSITSKTSMNVREELSEMLCRKNDLFRSPSFFEELTNDEKTHFAWEAPYAGDKAIERALKLFGYWLMKKKFRQFNLDSIKNNADVDKDVGPNFKDAIRQAVTELSYDCENDILDLIRWCVTIVECHVRRLGRLLRDNITMLDHAPGLRFYVEIATFWHYSRCYSLLVSRIENEAVNVLSLRFKQLNLQGIQSSVNLLRFVNSTCNLVPFDFANKPIDAKVERLNFIDTDVLNIDIPESMAREEKEKKVNGYIEMVARYNFGAFYQDLHNLVHKKLITLFTQRPFHNEVKEQIKRDIDNVLHDSERLNRIRHWVAQPEDLSRHKEMFENAGNLYTSLDKLNPHFVSADIGEISTDQLEKIRHQLETKLNSADGHSASFTPSLSQSIMETNKDFDVDLSHWSLVAEENPMVQELLDYIATLERKTNTVPDFRNKKSEDFYPSTVDESQVRDLQKEITNLKNENAALIERLRQSQDYLNQALQTFAELKEDSITLAKTRPIDKAAKTFLTRWAPVV